MIHIQTTFISLVEDLSVKIQDGRNIILVASLHLSSILIPDIRQEKWISHRNRSINNQIVIKNRPLAG